MNIKQIIFGRTTKFLAVILLVVTFMACNSDNSPTYDIQLSPLTDVEFRLNDEVLADSTTIGIGDQISIKAFYHLDECDQFDGFTMQQDEENENTYMIGAVIRVYESGSNECQNSEPGTKNGIMNFEPQGAGDYLFKFWNGVNSNEEAQYLERTLIVKADGEDSDDGEGDDNEG